MATTVQPRTGRPRPPLADAAMSDTLFPDPRPAPTTFWGRIDAEVLENTEVAEHRFPPRERRGVHLIRLVACALVIPFLSLIVVLVVVDLRQGVFPNATTSVRNDSLLDAVGRADVATLLNDHLAAVRFFERVSMLLTWISIAATMLIIGGAAYTVGISAQSYEDVYRPMCGERTLARGIGTALIATLLLIPSRAGFVAGTLHATGDAAAWWSVLISPVGSAVVLRLTGLILMWRALRAPSKEFRRPVVCLRAGLTVIGGLKVSATAIRRYRVAVAVSLLASSFVVIGHAQATDPSWLLVLCDVVHVLAGSVWFGGVALLALELRPGGGRSSAITAESVKRFSSIAGLAVVATAATGMVLAWGQLRSFDRLFSTSYGVTLIVKLGVVALVVAIGAYNHRHLVPTVTRRRGLWAWKRLRRTVWIETSLILGGVITMTVVLANGGLHNVAPH